MSYSSNLPPEIQEKVDRLTECQKQITGLESQLIQFKKEKDRLEEELVDYHVDKTPERPVSAVMVAAGRTNIQKLPDEMLLHIVEYFLSQNHRRIRRLLLVCRHWTRIIMQSPRLWAKIQLSANYQQYRWSSESLIQYVEACIQRSQPVLLDIELDYEALQTREDYLRDELLCAVSNITESSNLSEQVENLDFVSPEYDAYFDQTMKELTTLIGPMGTHMERWHSLHFRPPTQDSYLGLEILLMMCGVAPNLQSMSLSQIGDILVITDHGWFDEDETPFLSIPNLRSLKLDDSAAALYLEDIVMTPSTLVHLDICYDHTVRGLSQLQMFTALRTLNLHIGGYFGLRQVPEDESLSLSLPELRELGLKGYSLPLKTVQFNLPSLQCLKLSGGDPKFQLPANLFPEHIHWSLDPMSRMTGAIPPTLKAILQSCSRVTTISIFKAIWGDYETVLEVLRKVSDLPVPLKAVVVEQVGGKRIRIDVAPLRSQLNAPHS